MSDLRFIVCLLSVVTGAGCGDNLASDAHPAHGVVIPDEPTITFSAHHATRRYPGPSTETLDSGLDGKPELIKHFRYDARDRLVLREYDTFADRNIDYRQTVSIEAEGTRVVRETDSHGNGIVDVREVSILDASGNETRLEKDHDGNGTIDWILHRTFDDEQRRLTERIDRDGDGEADYGTLDQYANGQLIERRQVATNDLAETITVFEYEEGLLTSARIDLGADGTFDTIQRTKYDAEGSPLLVTVDLDNDGSLDTLVHFRYEAGLLVEEETDSNADGIPELREAFVYDADEQIIRRSLDYGADSVIDLVVRTSFVSGFVVAEEVDYGDDGVVDARETHRRDAFGNRLALERDADGDGVLDVTYWYGYGCF